MINRDLPDLAELASIGDPLMRAQAAGQAAVSLQLRCWPKPLVDMRRAAIAELLADGSRKRIWVARQLGISSSRLSQIVKATSRENEA